MHVKVIPIILHYLLIIILYYTKPALSKTEWVDPYDMNTFEQKTSLTPSQNSDKQCMTSDLLFTYYKRIVRHLLQTLAKDEAGFKGELAVKLSAEDHAILKQFLGSTLEDRLLIQNVDKILEKGLGKSTLEKYSEEVISYIDRFYFMCCNRYGLILTACLFVLFVAYKLLQADLTIGYVVKYLLFLAWVVDFAFTWINLLQEAELNKMADSVHYESVPVFCDVSKMSLWQYFLHKIGTEDECRKYHHVMFKDHFWAIAPATVIAHQMGVVILAPAQNIGAAMGGFVRGVLGSLPLGLNFILLPIVLLFSFTIICTFLCSVTHSSFSVNVCHLIKLEFGNRGQLHIRSADSISGRNLDRLLDRACENRIQTVIENDNDDVVTEAGDGSQRRIKKISTNQKKNEPETGSCGKRNKMLEIGKGEEPATSDEKVLPEIDEKSEEMKTTDKSGESEQQVKD